MYSSFVQLSRSAFVLVGSIYSNFMKIHFSIVFFGYVIRVVTLADCITNGNGGAKQLHPIFPEQKENTLNQINVNTWPDIHTSSLDANTKTKKRKQNEKNKCTTRQSCAQKERLRFKFSKEEPLQEFSGVQNMRERT